MKKVTEKTARAFRDSRRCKLSNSQVTIEKDNTYYYLHGNPIAVKSNDGKKLRISCCGWYTNTTKERLNGILYYYNLGRIFQKDWNWYYENPAGEKHEFHHAIDFIL